MKKHFLTAALAIFCLGSSVFAAARVQTAAPTFTLANSNGEQVSLDQFKGKTVVLEWTNDQCPYVKKHYESGNMQKLQADYTDKGIVWLSVISSAEGKQGYVTGSEANKLTSSRNAKPSHVLFDPKGDTGKKYGARTTPHMYIIDPKGELQYAGAIDSIKSANPADIPKATNYVSQALNEMLAGKAVSVPVSSPYGCSVKY